jgi:hypothetical protein
MPEREPVDAVLADQAGSLGGLDHVEQVVRVDARGHGQRVEVEPPADHRGGAQCIHGRGRESADPPSDDVLDRARRIVLGEQNAEVSAGTGQPGVLDDEEGVPFGPRTQGRRLAPGRPCTDDPLHHLCRLVITQAPELEQHRVPSRRRLPEVRQQPGGFGMCATRRHHQQALVGHRLDQHPQRAQAG